MNPEMTGSEDFRQQVQASGSSFLAGMAVLPKERRRAMHALYAFCRTVDDIADAEAPPAHKLAGLMQWRQRVARCARGEASAPLDLALMNAMQDYGMREDDLLAIIAGMEMDAGPPIVAPPASLLDLYCDRVASAVGRCSVRIFGCAGDNLEAADQVAFHLGRALQLTNILRDLYEDAVRGRLYLPREMLKDAGCDPAKAPLEILADTRVRAACRRVAQQADDHFARAYEAMRACPRDAMKAARLMGAYYAAILQRLRAQDWRRIDKRVRLSAFEKLFLFLRHCF